MTPGPFSGPFFRVALALALGLCGAACAAALGAAGPTVQLLAEVRTRGQLASDPLGFAPARVVKQAEEIFYTLRITNPGSVAMNPVVVTRAVPRNTRYIAGSATGAGAVVQYSVDGREFFDAAHLPPATRSPGGRWVMPYTHIRWRFDAPLPPKAVVLARFRAEFN